MAAQNGRELLLQIDSGSGYVNIGGFQSNSITINGEPVEITSKDSEGFKEYLPGAGLRSLSLSGDGVFVSDAAFLKAHDHMEQRTLADCKIILPGLGDYTGNFAIMSIDMSGSHNEAVTYSISLESSGTFTFTPEV